MRYVTKTATLSALYSYLHLSFQVAFLVILLWFPILMGYCDNKRSFYVAVSNVSDCNANRLGLQCKSAPFAR